jgi:hypothetical protein
MIKRFWFLVIVLGLTVVLWMPDAEAVPVTLTDFNSTAYIDSEYGMSQWTVDNVDHMYRQYFWYRLGATGGESDLSGLSPVVTQFAPNIAQIDYTDGLNGLTFMTMYSLYGGTAGSGTADIAEQIRIVNTGASAVDLHFFQYTDFDLGGTISDDYISGDLDSFTQGDYLSGGVFSETVATLADSFEPNTYPNLVWSLEDGSPTTLAYTSGTASMTGRLDYEWAFGWDIPLGPGGSVIISKDKVVHPMVPEPGMLILLGSGFVGLAAFARLKRRKTV